MEKILSICIPVYNGGETAYQHIKEILTYKNDDIEIVVSDNASTDNTLDLVKKIDDCRLKIITHKEDVGPFLNWYHALMAGTGKYVMLLNDSDRLIVSNLPKYLTFLKDVQYDIMRNIAGNIDIAGPKELTVAQAQFYFANSHPSYVVYRREALHSIKPLKCSFDTKFVSYPYNVWDAQVLKKYPLKLKKAYLNGDIAIVELPKDRFKMKSRTTPYIEDKHIPFTYENISNTFKNHIKILRYLYPKDNEYSKLLSNAYKVNISGATLGFYTIMYDPKSLWMKSRYGLDKLDDSQIDYTKLSNRFFCTTVSRFNIHNPIWKVITISRLGLITLYNQNHFLLGYNNGKKKYVSKQLRRILNKLLSILVDKMCE